MNNSDNDQTPNKPSDIFMNGGNLFKFFKLSVFASSQQLEEQSKILARKMDDIDSMAEAIVAQLENLEKFKRWQIIRQFLILLPFVMVFSGLIFWLGYQYGHDEGMGLAEFVLYATEQCGYDWSKEEPCTLLRPKIPDK